MIRKLHVTFVNFGLVSVSRARRKHRTTDRQIVFDAKYGLLLTGLGCITMWSSNIVTFATTNITAFEAACCQLSLTLQGSSMILC